MLVAWDPPIHRLHNERFSKLFDNVHIRDDREWWNLLSNESSGARYDRQVPDELIRALAPGGSMHELVELVRSPLGKHKALDLRLRARLRHPGGRATLYLGLTHVLQIHCTKGGHFKLEGQGGKSFKEHLDPTLFDEAWSRAQPLENLAARWQRVMTYVKAAVEAAPAKYVSSEGKAQARLAREHELFTLVDREVVISFPDQHAKDVAVGGQTAGVLEARKTLGRSNEPWAQRERSFGTELDGLAVDTDGHVLVIEVNTAATPAASAGHPRKSPSTSAS